MIANGKKHCHLMLALILDLTLIGFPDQLIYTERRPETLLIRVTAAQPSPRPFLFQNLDAIVLNQGIEFVLAYDFVQSDNFNLDASFNIAYNENELQDFARANSSRVLLAARDYQGHLSQLLAGGQPFIFLLFKAF